MWFCAPNVDFARTIVLVLRLAYGNDATAGHHKGYMSYHTVAPLASKRNKNKKGRGRSTPTAFCKETMPNSRERLPTKKP